MGWIYRETWCRKRNSSSEYKDNRDKNISAKTENYPTDKSKDEIIEILKNKEIDLIVICYTYFWFYLWEDIKDFFQDFSGKIVFIYGADGKEFPILPPCRIDKIFRREISKDEVTDTIVLSGAVNKNIVRKEFISYKYRTLDVFFVGNWAVSNRWEIGRLLFNIETERKLRVLYGTNCSIERNEFFRIVSESKISLHIRGGGWDCYRLWELFSQGTCVFAEEPDIRLDEDFFIDGESIIFFNRENFKEKLLYYLGHPEEMERVALNSHKLLQEKHLNINRAEKVLRSINCQ